MGLLALATRAVILVWGQVDDGLGVAVVGARHDGDVRRARRCAAGDPQRQVVCFRARVDKVGDLRIANSSNEAPSSAGFLLGDEREMMCANGSQAEQTHYITAGLAVLPRQVREMQHRARLTERGSGKVAVNASAYVHKPSCRYLMFVLRVASWLEMADTTCRCVRLQGLCLHGRYGASALLLISTPNAQQMTVP